jgi:hypothetical protein
LVTNLDEPALELDPAQRVGSGRRERRAGIRRLEGVDRQHVLDVHEQQLLVLLLVVEAELDDRRQLLERTAVEGGDQVTHAGVDVGAVAADVVGARPGDESALGPGVAGADALVVAVEEEPVLVLVRLERRLVLGEHERLEEPGDVRAVPLRRRDVGHRLDGLVLGGQGRGERLGVGAHLVVAGDERVGVPSRIGHR